LENYKKYITFTNAGKPFFIQDNPESNRQNVSFKFITFMDFHTAPDEFPTEITKFKTKEVEFVKWMEVIEVYNSIEDDWAFKHNEAIKQAIIFYNTR